MKKNKIKFIVCCMFILLLCGCGSNEIDYKKLMSENEYVIIDVRTKEEYNSSHLVGAINIPYDQIDESINLDKENIILVYCMSGMRSNKAFFALKNLGYEVYDLGAFSEIDLPKQ